MVVTIVELGNVIMAITIKLKDKKSHFSIFQNNKIGKSHTKIIFIYK